jgi:hypothetical protein
MTSPRNFGSHQTTLIRHFRERLPAAHSLARLNLSSIIHLSAEIVTGPVGRGAGGLPQTTVAVNACQRCLSRPIRTVAILGFLPGVRYAANCIDLRRSLAYWHGQLSRELHAHVFEAGISNQFVTSRSGERLALEVPCQLFVSR